MSDNFSFDQPLAYRMAPRSLDEYIGQEHIIGEGKMLRRMIKADRLSSIILFGPPGVGKTALARLIASCSASNFEKINAVSAGVSDIKEIVSKASNPIMSNNRKTVLFIDEIHRFNKLQQDALLPYVEDGTLIMIGATTENPFFEVNKALVSRATVLQLKPLNEKDVIKILSNALSDKERGYGNLDINISDSTLASIAEASGGDARNALKALELAVITTPPDSNGTIIIDADIISDCMQTRISRFDKDGESHYDNISAMIKSMRGSNPDAAVLYLARALAGGEDPRFLARRVLICAAEDVGLANPNALLIAEAAFQAVTQLGMPEARIPLAEAVIMVATSPKSNSAYNSINWAISDVENRDTGEIPMYLRNAPADGMKDLGYSVGYKYAHDYPEHYVKLDFMPDKSKNETYYEAGSLGYEVNITKWMRHLNEISQE